MYLLQSLMLYSYGEGTLLDYFDQTYDEMKANITELYPLVASLSDGQLCALNEQVSLFTLIKNAFNADLNNGSATSKTAQAQKDMTAEDTQVLNEMEEEIDELTVTGNKAGGIWTASNNMFIASCDIRDNVGFSGGGGIYVGEGGILNFMSTCVVKDNRTTYYTNNVTLAATGETAGKWAFITASGLASGSSIGINNQSATVSTPQVRNIKESQTGYFFSDEGQKLEFRKTGEGTEIYMATAITPFSYAMYVLIGLELVGAAFVLFTVIRKRSKRKEEESDEAAETA